MSVPSAVAVLAVITLVLAVIPALMVMINAFFYRRAPRVDPKGKAADGVSILIPARNESKTIAATVRAALASEHIAVEVVVGDDQSTDDTASQVVSLAEADPRLRLVRLPSLPEGWCGKQHACARLAEAARHPHLLFVDADVRLAPDAAARLVAARKASNADLVSGLPGQQVGTWLERWIIPLVPFVLLGYLPFPGMRWSRSPAFAAGCGQLMLARTEAYRAVGGHSAIRASRHDGLTLPRQFRRQGCTTTMVDATDLASCRMYEDTQSVWLGFAKNADEGMASPRAIGVWTLLLGGGQVLPPLLLIGLLAMGAAGSTVVIAAIATALGPAIRLFQAWRYRLPWRGALEHPFGVAALLGIQWYALRRAATGHRVAWKGRVSA